ncbi:MAG TPA: hypothetical protein VFI86_09330 [Burkholderiales bacterium]|nr:hypothetical protein [Burkholderiales bacterium]
MRRVVQQSLYAREWARQMKLEAERTRAQARAAVAASRDRAGVATTWSDLLRGRRSTKR